MKKIYLLALGTVFFSGISINNQNATVLIKDKKESYNIIEVDTLLVIDSIPNKVEKLNNIMLEIKKINNESNQ